MSEAAAEKKFSPKIVAFLCNWCSYRASDMAGTSRIKFAPQVRLIRVMCSGRVDPVFILKAFALGADGVMIAGCHPGDCHYIEQNYKTIRRYIALKQTLRQFGIEEERLKLVWASAAEGHILAEEITKFVETLKKLGPLHWRENLEREEEEEKDIEAIAREHEEVMEVPV